MIRNCQARLATVSLLACLCPAGLTAANPERWVPARWDGGPLESARRAKENPPEAIANWYDPSTLALLDGTPINCLLLTLSAGADAALEARQYELVKQYARAARERGIAALGIVYPGSDLAAASAKATEAGLDGLVLDGEFPAGAAAPGAALVIRIAPDAAPLRHSDAPVVAVQGIRPNVRDLADMGIRSGPSAEPWIQSNIWLVRSFRLGPAPRTVWISQEANPSSLGDYVRSVADAAIAGGRWIVSLDDSLRSRLLRKEDRALATWRGLTNYLKFAEDHADWRAWAPYGNLAIILDTASETPDISNEYLNLVARRQVPYRIIERRQFGAESLAGFQAVLAADLAPPTESERKLLGAFAERGGLVIASPLWGNPPKTNPYEEHALGKGRVIVYKDDPPDPEAVARDMLELLNPEVMGLSAFNVPSVLTYASAGDSGKRVLVQFLNYASSPFNSRVTIRINGAFSKARWYTPEDPPADLPVRPARNGRTEVSIARLAVWGALLLE